MLQALQRLHAEYRFSIDVIDVDSDQALVAQFDELVPVLFGQTSGAPAVRLCHYFFDENKVRGFLDAIEPLPR